MTFSRVSMDFSLAWSPFLKRSVETSLRPVKVDSLVRTEVTQRNSQSSLNLNPALSQRVRRLLSSSRASGQAAQMRARARSPLESLVPPLLTLLNISTTSSTVLSAPETSSIWKFRSLML